MGCVFINYRREETAGEARALFSDLVAAFGKDTVFMDVDTIALGRDFRDVIREKVETCDLMLALIGREWLEVGTSRGRRIDDPNDFVRLEIEAALKRNIPVTPVLVQGAQMPTADQLPEGLRDFAYRNGFELSHSRWQSDVQEMIKRLGAAMAGTSAGRAPETAQPERAGEQAPSQARSAGTPAPVENQPKRRRWGALAAAVLAVAAIAGGGLVYQRQVAEENARVQEDARNRAAEAEKNRLAEAEAEKTRLAQAEAEKNRLAEAEAEKMRLAQAEAEKARLAQAEVEKKRAAEAEQRRVAEEAERRRELAARAERTRIAEEKRQAAIEAEKQRQLALDAEKQRMAEEGRRRLDIEKRRVPPVAPTAPPSASALRRAALWGGKGGVPFDDRNVLAPDGTAIKIVQVAIRSGDYIDSLQVFYEGGGASPVHGGEGGTLKVFRLAPDECIVGVAGKYSGYVIESLRLRTNKRRVAAWGPTGALTFDYGAPEGMCISGFFGRSGAYLDAVGVYVHPAR